MSLTWLLLIYIIACCVDNTSTEDEPAETPFIDTCKKPTVTPSPPSKRKYSNDSTSQDSGINLNLQDDSSDTKKNCLAVDIVNLQASEELKGSDNACSTEGKCVSIQID